MQRPLPCGQGVVYILKRFGESFRKVSGDTGMEMLRYQRAAAYNGRSVLFMIKITIDNFTGLN